MTSYNKIINSKDLMRSWLNIYRYALLDDLVLLDAAIEHHCELCTFAKSTRDRVRHVLAVCLMREGYADRMQKIETALNPAG